MHLSEELSYEYLFITCSEFLDLLCFASHLFSPTFSVSSLCYHRRINNIFWGWKGSILDIRLDFDQEEVSVLIGFRSNGALGIPSLALLAF